MEIITAREFRTNQSRYLNEVKNGGSVILTSREGNFKIVPIDQDDIVINKDLLDSLREVKMHMNGQSQLPNARDLVF